MAQIVTASRLADGAVVFLAAEGTWSDRLDRAAVFERSDCDGALEAGRAAEAANLVVDVYAVDVSVQGGGIVPIKLREAIRARGPTIHPELAKPGSTPAAVEEADDVSV